MPRVCSVCAHPQRGAIDAAIVGGEAKRGIARRFAVSADAVERHVKHVARKVQAAEKREASTLADHLGRERGLVLGVVERVEREREAAALTPEEAEADPLARIASVQARVKLEELTLKAVDRLTRLTDLEFGRRDKLELAPPKGEPVTPEEKLASLEQLREEIEESLAATRSRIVNEP